MRRRVTHWILIFEHKGAFGVVHKAVLRRDAMFQRKDRIVNQLQAFGRGDRDRDDARRRQEDAAAHRRQEEAAQRRAQEKAARIEREEAEEKSERA